MDTAELDIAKLEISIIEQLETLTTRVQSVLGQLRLARALRVSLPSPQTPPEDART